MTTIEALEAGMAAWRQSVNYYGTYVMRYGWTTTSFDDALAGRFGPAFGSGEDRLEGIVVKVGHFLRASGTWDKPPHYTENASTISASRVSFESVGCGEFYFDYETYNPKPAREIVIYRRVKEDLGVLRAGGLGSMIDPFVFQGGDSHRPISRFFEADGTKLVKAEAKVDAAHVVIRLERERAGMRAARTLWFSREYTPPLLIRQQTVSYNADGSEGMRSEIHAHNIVPVEGGSMASVLRIAQGPVRDATGDSIYIARLWVSEDLGRRAPIADDLAVEIGPEIEIIGLRNAPPPGKRRRFALNQYTVEDLQEPEEGPVAVPRRAPPALPAPPSKLPRPIMVILGAVCVAAVGALIWRARRRRKAG